jgi:hypothetical protein
MDDDLRVMAREEEKISNILVGFRYTSSGKTSTHEK